MRLAAALVLGCGCDVVFPVGSGAATDGSLTPLADASPPPPDAGPLICPPSYAIDLGTTSRYQMGSIAAWPDAAALCAVDQWLVPPGSAAHTHLVVLDDNAELAAIVATFPANTLWIGLSDINTEGQFLTVSTQTPPYPPPTGAPWGVMQPDDGGGNTQDCVRIMGSGQFDPSKLDDDFCTGTTNSYLCECDAYADDPTKY